MFYRLLVIIKNLIIYKFTFISGVSLKMVIKRAGCTKESKKAARRLTDDSLNILAETKEHLQTLKDDYGQWTMGTTNRYTQDLIQQFVYLQQNLRRLERLGKWNYKQFNLYHIYIFREANPSVCKILWWSS